MAVIKRYVAANIIGYHAMETLGPILQMVQFQRFYKRLEVEFGTGHNFSFSEKDQVFCKTGPKNRLLVLRHHLIELIVSFQKNKTNGTKVMAIQ